MPIGMKIYLVVCGIVAVVISASSLSSMIGNGLRGRWKDDLWLNLLGLGCGLFIAWVALAAMLGVFK